MKEKVQRANQATLHEVTSPSFGTPDLNHKCVLSRIIKLVKCVVWVFQTFSQFVLLIVILLFSIFKPKGIYSIVQSSLAHFKYLYVGRIRKQAIMQQMPSAKKKNWKSVGFF